MEALETGKRIQQKRKEHGWTQKELAERLHVTDRAISKWERGLNYPDMAMLEPLAGALDTTVAELLCIENAPAEQKLEAVTAVAVEETERLRKEIRTRALSILSNGIVLYGSQLVLYLLLAKRGFHDSVYRALTIGMGSFTGLMIGNALRIWWEHRK